MGEMVHLQTIRFVHSRPGFTSRMGQFFDLRFLPGFPRLPQLHNTVHDHYYWNGSQRDPNLGSITLCCLNFQSLINQLSRHSQIHILFLLLAIFFLLFIFSICLLSCLSSTCTKEIMQLISLETNINLQFGLPRKQFWSEMKWKQVFETIFISMTLITT